MLYVIPLTDIALKSPTVRPKTPAAYERTVAAEKHRRAAGAKLQGENQLEQWTRPILAYRLGKYFNQGRGQSRVSRLLVDGLLAIAGMFEVGRDLTYVRSAGRIDAYGWRRTSVSELGRIGSGLTEAQARYILGELSFTGFIECDHGSAPKQRRGRLFIRFRPDRIREAIHAVTVVRRAEKERRHAVAAENQPK